MSAFGPQGNTVAITSAATSTTPVQVASASGGSTSYRLQVVGAVPMYFTWGMTSALTPAAVIPVNGTPANGYLVQAGVLPVTITAPPNAFFATIATATSSTGYITPGNGG